MTLTVSLLAILRECHCRAWLFSLFLVWSMAGCSRETSPDLFTVLTTALEVGQKSEGAYDVTVMPLVNLWGFGPKGITDTAPDARDIAKLLEQVGQSNIRLDSENIRVMKLRDLSLDFSSLAKGYGVDRVAQWLTAQGIHRFMVEVGGEMRLSGLSGRSDPWRIAIEQPESSGRSVAVTINLTDVARSDVRRLPQLL